MRSEYKRVLLKLSGEVLSGDKGHGFDFDIIGKICDNIKACRDMGVEIGIVNGGGNFWRGRSSGSMNRTRADHIGMLATVMNAICLCDCLEQTGVKAAVLSQIDMGPIAEPYSYDRMEALFAEGKVILFAAGTGLPYFSTDTAASLKAAQIGADLLLKATNVDGVYNKDPNKFPDAVKLDTLTHDEIVREGYGVMDAASAAMCRENNIDILVFNLTDPDNITRALSGERIGTLVTG